MEEVYVVGTDGFITTSEVDEIETLEDVLVDIQDVDPIEPSSPALEPSQVTEDLFQPEAIVIPYSAGNDPAALSDEVEGYAAGDDFDLDNMVVFRATVSGYGECVILCPPDEADNLTIENGMIYNWSDHNILCPLFPGEVSDRQSTNTLFITFMGRASSSFATNTYRNGSAQYVTSYAVSTANSLQSTNTYVSVSGVQQEGYSFTFWFMVVLAIVAVLMGVNALLRLFKRGF